MQALRPWLGMLERCTKGASKSDAMLTRAARVLNALAGDGPLVPIPASIAAAEHRFDAGGQVRDLRPARELREIREDRDAVLGLGLSARLEHFTANSADAGGDAFDRLMAQVSRHDIPGLMASRRRGAWNGAFAQSDAAKLFFNGRLKASLSNLARLYDERGSDFARWLRLPAYDARTASFDSWMQAWTVAVVATYVDWLHSASQGDMRVAIELAMLQRPKRFRTPARVLHSPRPAGADPARPAVLPTDDDRMHFELLLGVVLAQVLDYDEVRWEILAQGARSFAVELSMKSLDQADTRRWDGDLRESRNFTRYRGLAIGQIYAAAAIEMLQRLAQEPS